VLAAADFGLGDVELVVGGVGFAIDGVVVAVVVVGVEAFVADELDDGD